MEFWGKTLKIREFGSRERFQLVLRMCVLCHVFKLCPLTDWLWWLSSGYARVNVTQLSRQ